jgi:hypothetical protein
MDVWVITGLAKQGEKLFTKELWTAPNVVPFAGVVSDTDTYYVYRSSPTEQVSYSQPIKFGVEGGVAPYTHYSGAIFFKWLDGDTSTPVLSYDWTTNPFRPNGGDYIEESSLTGHGATDSSFINQTMKKKLRLVAIDYSSEHLPAEYSNATGVLRIPELNVLNGLQFKKVQAKIESLGNLTIEAKYSISTLDASNPLALVLYLPKVLVDGAMTTNVKVSGFTYSSAGYYD